MAEKTPDSPGASAAAQTSDKAIAPEVEEEIQRLRPILVKMGMSGVYIWTEPNAYQTELRRGHLGLTTGPTYRFGLPDRPIIVTVMPKSSTAEEPVMEEITFYLDQQRAELAKIRNDVGIVTSKCNDTRIVSELCRLLYNAAGIEKEAQLASDNNLRDAMNSTASTLRKMADRYAQSNDDKTAIQTKLEILNSAIKAARFSNLSRDALAKLNVEIPGIFNIELDKEIDASIVGSRRTDVATSVDGKGERRKMEKRNFDIPHKIDVEPHSALQRAKYWLAKSLDGVRERFYVGNDQSVRIDNNLFVYHIADDKEIREIKIPVADMKMVWIDPLLSNPGYADIFIFQKTESDLKEIYIGTFDMDEKPYQEAIRIFENLDLRHKPSVADQAKVSPPRSANNAKPTL